MHMSETSARMLAVSSGPLIYGQADPQVVYGEGTIWNSVVVAVTVRESAFVTPFASAFSLEFVALSCISYFGERQRINSEDMGEQSSGLLV